MTEPMQISELFATIIDWIASKGVEDISKLPGLWTGETPEWKVEINGVGGEIDDLPYLHVRLRHKRLFQLGIISPTDGAIGGGAREDEMIEHFRSEAKAS